MSQIAPPHPVMEQAAEWYGLLCSGEATDQDRARWRAWLADHPQHQQAWGYVETVSQRFSPIQSSADPRQTANNLWRANQRLIQRRRMLSGMIAFAGTSLLGCLSWRHTSLPSFALALNADLRTATGEIREVTLDDGTRLWLNTATALNRAFDQHQRLLHLITGEVLIDTAPDVRPFLVQTPQARLRALGTRFTVRLNEQDTLLTVFEGAAEITLAAGYQQIIRAGQQVRFRDNQIDDIQKASSANEAWSRGILVARDIPLRDVVNELRRYRSGHLGLAPDVADLKVFGSFPLANSDQALDLLAYALPIRIKQTTPWWVSIEPAAPSQ